MVAHHPGRVEKPIDIGVTTATGHRQTVAATGITVGGSLPAAATRLTRRISNHVEVLDLDVLVVASSGLVENEHGHGVREAQLILIMVVLLCPMLMLFSSPDQSNGCCRRVATSYSIDALLLERGDCKIVQLVYRIVVL